MGEVVPVVFGARCVECTNPIGNHDQPYLPKCRRCGLDDLDRQDHDEAKERDNE